MAWHGIAKYLAAALQKISFYHRHAVLTSLDSTVKKQTAASGSAKFSFHQSPFKKGAMSLATWTLLEKTLIDGSTLSTSCSGVELPLLFGGKLIKQLVEKSDDTTKTQKGLDHLLTAHYGQSALKSAKPSSQQPAFPAAKRGHWDTPHSSCSFSSGRFSLGELFCHPSFNQRFSWGHWNGGQRWDYQALRCYT